ncbi:MAG: outer membrane lipoprotein-sorting protein [Verrucomicrobiota bacterium]
MNPRLPLLLLGAALLLGASVDRPAKPKPLDPAEAAAKGRELVVSILSQRPADSFTNNGVLKIRDAKRNWTETPIQVDTVATPTNWMSIYTVGPTNGARESLVITHEPGGHTAYTIGNDAVIRTQAGNELMIPFAGSDFWLVDLGLEFFHWPDQRLLRNEISRSRACHVLESTNPQPAAGAYARVLSWIDDETSGIVHAEAYDSNNKLLKEFDPKDFKKVNGQWRLEEMQIENPQAKTRTRIEFNFDN